MTTPATETAPAPLTGSHKRTYDAIFQHPISRNLAWHDVHAMFRQLGTVEEESNGKLKVTRNGQKLILHPPRTKDVSEKDEVMSLRHFLERSEAIPCVADESAAHWLLVIDHREARIFRSETHGSAPHQILPPEPEDYFRHAYKSKDFSRGKEKPDPNSFFEPVAKALQGASQILVFGAGKGMSSEMEQFLAWSKKHHPRMAGRIIGTLTVDESHLTEDQLLAKAREFYAKAGAVGKSPEGKSPESLPI